MKFASRLILVALAFLPLLYFNCARPKASELLRNSYVPPGVKYETSAATATFDVLPDGTIKVLQDKELNYSPSGGASGLYTISDLPTWASFDSTTGTVKGTPRKLTDTGTFTIFSSANSKTYGPFTVKVIGDELKEQQWHLLNTGQKAYALSGGMMGADLHLSQAIKDNVLGIGVRVAISDSGAVLAHPDLQPNVLVGESRSYLQNGSAGNWYGDPTPSSADPEDAHGTAVAGLLAAKGWNGIGGRGVAPEVGFAAFLFLQAQDYLSQIGLLDAGLYDQFAGNFDVFNFSWGDPQCMLTEYPQTFRDKIAYGAATQRRGLGSSFVIANGNSFTEDTHNCFSSVAAGSDFVLGNVNFSELNTTPYSINVAAMNADGVSASYSTPGAATWITATGGEYGWSKANSTSPEANEPALLTTDFPGCNNGLKALDKDNSTFDAGADPNSDCKYVNTMNGTSGATPTASGAIALMLQVNADLSWRDVKYILAKTADKIDPTASMPTHPISGSNLPGYVYDLPWITNAAGFHFHNWYGFGAMNIDKAVAMAKTYTFPLGSFKSTGFSYDSGSINVSVPDRSAAGITRSMTVNDVMSIEAVQLRLSINNCAADIGLELTSPSGTKSILMNINSRLRDTAISNHIFLSNAFYGEPSAGTWTLRVVDGKAGCSAALANWKLNFFGH